MVPTRSQIVKQADGFADDDISGLWREAAAAHLVAALDVELARGEIAGGAVAMRDDERVPARRARLDRHADLGQHLAAQPDEGNVPQPCDRDNERSCGCAASGKDTRGLGGKIEGAACMARIGFCAWLKGVIVKATVCIRMFWVR